MVIVADPAPATGASRLADAAVELPA